MLGKIIAGVPGWAALLLAYLVWVLVLLVVKRIGFRFIAHLAQHTKTQLDDIFVSAIDFPLNLLAFASGGFIVEKMIPVAREGALTPYFAGGVKAIAIVAAIIFTDNFIRGLLAEYTEKVEILKTSGGIVHGFIRAIVFGLGGLILLDSFGVSITPIIASLGIGSLAIALALQPTLENLFAGIQIVADKPIQLGHFVRLDSGEEGYVHKIGWRSTWIRLPPNNMVVMPNKVLVNSKILNYHYPEKDMSFGVEIGVHYDSDLNRVEQVSVDVAKQTLSEVPGGVANFEPVMRFHTFGDFSVNGTVVLRAKEISDTSTIKHEFIKRLHKRFKAEGIVIPYPIQAVNYSQEKSSLPRLGQD